MDERGGPNHVGNWCYAPFLYDRQTKTLMPQPIQKFYWHFSHTIRPGARRIGTTKYTDLLEVTAFQKEDGGIALVLFNQDKAPQTVHLRLNGLVAAFALPGQAIASGEITL